MLFILSNKFINFIKLLFVTPKATLGCDCSACQLANDFEEK